MGGKHLKLRTIVIVAIIAVFAFSIYPLAPRDFYETFFKALKVKDDAVAAELVSDAKQLQAGRPDLSQAAALLEAAEAKKVDLLPLGEGDLPIPAIVAATPDRVNNIVVELDYCRVEMVEALKRSYKYMTSNGLALGNK